MTAPQMLMTADELMHYEAPGKRVELVRGRLLVREPAGLRHSALGVRIAHCLLAYLERERATESSERSRGLVFGADAGFLIGRSPDTVRAPDVAFVSAARWSSAPPVGFGDFAPDLAVEVRSPSDRPGALTAKVGDWLSAGTRLVWVVDPPRQQVVVYSADERVSVLGIGDKLSGEEVLPGFALPLSELFAAM